MTLYELPEFERYVKTLKGTTLHNQWDAYVAKIGPRFYAAFGLPDGQWKNCIIFKTTATSYEIMISQQGIKRPPYMQGTWVAVDRHSILEDDELRQYVAQSYQLVAKGLTRQTRKDLGIIL